MTAKNGKPCKKCGTSDWDRWGSCKECGRERNRQWHANNYEKALEINRQWKLNNQDRVAECNKRWREANPEKNLDHKRRWKQSHPDKVAEQKRRYRQSNPNKPNAITHRYRTRKTQAGGSYTAAEFRELCDHYGNKCLKCGRNNVKLTADHIKPVIKGGNSNIDNIQPLCGSCNSSKGDRHIDYRPDAGPLRWLQCKLFG